MTQAATLHDQKKALQSLLIVEDDDTFRTRLEKAMIRHGFSTRSAPSVADAMDVIHDDPPEYAIVDLRLRDGNGLDVVDCLKEAHPKARAIVLTGYGNVPTAVAAVQAGAIDYLAKPATAEDIAGALRAPPGKRAPMPENAVNPDQAKMIHIFDVFMQCDENMSETSRKLNMHRRTLQRMIKRARDRA